MLDPYWLGGARRHVRRTRPAAAVFLVRDPSAPALKEVPAREALRWVSEGSLPGAGDRCVPFLNPHLPLVDPARQELLRHQYERLFGSVRCVVANAALGAPDTLAGRLLGLLG